MIVWAQVIVATDILTVKWSCEAVVHRQQNMTEKIVAPTLWHKPGQILGHRQLCGAEEVGQRRRHLPAGERHQTSVR